MEELKNDYYVYILNSNLNYGIYNQRPPFFGMVDNIVCTILYGTYTAQQLNRIRPGKSIISL